MTALSIDLVTGWATAAVAFVRRLVQFPLSERIDFYVNMKEMRHGNVTVIAALLETAEGNERLKRRYATMYRGIYEELRAGRSIPEVFAPHIPSSELMVLAAGARANDADGFAGAARIATSVQRMRGALAGALAYPLVLIYVAMMMLAEIGEKLVPQIERANKGQPFDTETTIYIGLVRFVDSYQGWVAIGFGVVVLAIGLLLPWWRGAGRSWADRFLPPFMLYRLYTAASFILALGCLTRTALTTREALEAMYPTASRYLQSHVERMLLQVCSGHAEIEAFRTGLLPPTLIIRISALAKAGGISQSLTLAGESITDYCVSAITAVGATSRYAVLGLIGLIIAYTLSFLNSVGTGSPLPGGP